MGNRLPIVFVHGLLGWGQRKVWGLPYFGLAWLGVGLGRLAELDFAPSARALFPSVGPISSDHDRACELFYQLKGGDVHYGEAHAREHGHLAVVPHWRKGKRPLYPVWDEAHPLHFVGQAQGACTVRRLQHLLAQGDFFLNPTTGKPYPTSAKWVFSLASISAIFNGTPAVYVLGCSPEDGRAERFSMAAYLGHTAFGLESEPGRLWRFIDRQIYSFDLAQWRGVTQFISGTDNAAYDLSIHGAQAADYLEDFDCTYYLSYLTSLTRKEPEPGHFIPKPGMNPFFRYVGEELGCFAGPLQNLKYPITDFSPWRENDGLAPVYTQDYPKWGRPRRFEKSAAGVSLKRGVWNVMDTLEMDHMNTVALPRLTRSLRQPLEQIRFYKCLYQRLANLE